MMKGIVLCLFGLLCASLPVCAQTTGSVRGVVRDEHGNPIANAEVHIAEMKPFMGHRLLRFFETDQDGNFLISGVPWGTYGVLAGKDTDGYPDTKLAFYSNGTIPTVTVLSNHPLAQVVVNLGPKAGILHLDPVLDAVTKKRVEDASITLRRVSNKNFSISTSASANQILLPPFTEIDVEITAPGYKSWPTDSSEAHSTISVKPQEIFNLVVSMTPEDKSSEIKPPKTHRDNLNK